MEMGWSGGGNGASVGDSQRGIPVHIDVLLRLSVILTRAEKKIQIQFRRPNPLLV